MADKKKMSNEEQEEIVRKFQQMRKEQRSFMSKISELEQDLNEHKAVIETLEQVSPDRKCARMISGVLVERTAKEILPALITNRDQLTKVIETLNDQLVSKGKELNDYREKHGIRVKGDEPVAVAQNKSEENKTNQGTTGVLVSNKS